jgi:hypothetical protein
VRRLRKWRIKPCLDGWLLRVGYRKVWGERKKDVLLALVNELARRDPSDVLVRIHRKDGSLLETRIFPRDAVPKAWLR